MRTSCDSYHARWRDAESRERIYCSKRLNEHGKLRFTLVLKDPFGNSTIISDKAKKRRIGARELKGLKFGEQAIAARKMQ